MTPRRRTTAGCALPGSPFLTYIGLKEERVEAGAHPFDVPCLRGLPLELHAPVTFLVGENGSGKSTLLEGIAWALGFGTVGGERDRSYAEGTDGHQLGRALELHWRQRVTDGFFLRAETFFDWVRSMEAAGATFGRFGGFSLNARSHGEAFLSVVTERLEDGVYLLDEPEAALSPARQLALLRVLHELASRRIAQFIIATHSPILISLPGATVLQVDDEMREVDYRETEHFQLTRDFLAAPERYLHHLLGDEEAGERQEN